MPARVPSVVLVPVVVFDIFRQFIIGSKKVVVAVVTGCNHGVGDDHVKVYVGLVSFGEEHVHPFPLTHVIIRRSMAFLEVTLNGDVGSAGVGILVVNGSHPPNPVTGQH